MKVDLPEGEYVKNITINDDGVDINFAPRKKVALLFISINQNYWPYLAQVIQDCKQNFLPQHKVDYLIWSDIPEENTTEYENSINSLLPEADLNKIFNETGVRPNGQFFSREAIMGTVDYIRNLKEKSLFYTGSVGWPAPTLMRYHLFLNEVEKLKDYDYIFYMDADMRVVSKVSDEVLGEGLTCAPHPGYALAPRFVPPYEPNKESKAYIHRLGRLVDEGGKQRFMPFYAAGGFQGGVASKFIEAMQEMKKDIDKDFDNNYTAIWNDESHWNRYLWDYQGPTTFLDVSYVYPDSLIKEYYEPLWGRSYEPKIITLTKPFSLSKQAGGELSQILGNVDAPKGEIFSCPTCGDKMEYAGHKIIRVVTCPGKGKPHQVEMKKI